jgi:hypothetical protein
MKIAARFATSNSTAVNARRLLLGQRLIYKSGSRYYTAPRARDPAADAPAS